MVAFLTVRSNSMELMDDVNGALSPFLESLYVRQDGRLLLGNVEFGSVLKQSHSSTSRSKGNRQSVQYTCYAFVHSVLAATLCLSRSVPLRATRQSESYTKKTFMFYLRQHSSLSIHFPELTATSHDDVVLQIRSSSSRVKERNYDTFNAMNRSSSSIHLPRNKHTAGDTRSSGNSSNVIDVDYNCVNTEGAVDQIAELRVTGIPPSTAAAGGMESYRVEGTHWTLDVEAMNPGKLLIDISTNPRGISLCKNGGQVPKTLYYEYEIMVVIVPREAHVSHKSLESVEITAFIEEAHRMKNPALLFGSHLLQGQQSQSSMLAGAEVGNSRATSHAANMNRLTTAQLGKVWRNFVNSLP